MEETKYSIELHENNTVGRALRILLGVACIVVGVWFIYSIRGTAASVETSWVAIVFLFLFGLWMIAAGLGHTERYIIIGDDRIVLRQYFYKKPVTYTPSSLRSVEFRPVVIHFVTEAGKTTLRMGTMYPERTSSIMQAVKQFCLQHGIEVTGEFPGEKKTESGT